MGDLGSQIALRPWTPLQKFESITHLRLILNSLNACWPVVQKELFVFKNDIKSKLANLIFRFEYVETVDAFTIELNWRINLKPEWFRREFSSQDFGQ